MTVLIDALWYDRSVSYYGITSFCLLTNIIFSGSTSKKILCFLNLTRKCKWRKTVTKRSTSYSNFISKRHEWYKQIFFLWRSQYINFSTKGFKILNIASWKFREEFHGFVNFQCIIPDKFPLQLWRVVEFASKCFLHSLELFWRWVGLLTREYR